MTHWLHKSSLTSPSWVTPLVLQLDRCWSEASDRISLPKLKKSWVAWNWFSSSHTGVSERTCSKKCQLSVVKVHQLPENIRNNGRLKWAHIEIEIGEHSLNYLECWSFLGLAPPMTAGSLAVPSEQVQMSMNGPSKFGRRIGGCHDLWTTPSDGKTWRPPCQKWWESAELRVAVFLERTFVDMIAVQSPDDLVCFLYHDCSQ